MERNADARILEDVTQSCKRLTGAVLLDSFVTRHLLLVA